MKGKRLRMKAANRVALDLDQGAVTRDQKSMTD
jgi:hypothetical protein